MLLYVAPFLLYPYYVWYMGPKQLRRIPQWAGLTSCRRSIDFGSGELIVRFLLRKPRVWFPLVAMFEMCWFHRRSDVIVTPRYITESTTSSTLPWGVYSWVSGSLLRDTRKTWHLFVLNSMSHLFSQFSSSCRSFYGKFVSLCDSTARYRGVSSTNRLTVEDMLPGRSFK